MHTKNNQKRQEMSKTLLERMSSSNWLETVTVMEVTSKLDSSKNAPYEVIRDALGYKRVYA